MVYPNNLYQLNIDNATLQIGKAVRYFAHQHLEDKSKSAIVGRYWKSEAKLEDSYEHYLPFGYSIVCHQGDRYQIKVSKTGEALETLSMTLMHPFEISIELLETDEIKYGAPEYEEYKKKNNHLFQQKVKKFIAEAQKYYDTYITEVEDKSGVIGIYIFDDYWELLNRHQPRKIETVCLDGKEKEVLEYIKKFKSSAVKKRYLETGTPYKKYYVRRIPRNRKNKSYL